MKPLAADGSERAVRVRRARVLAGVAALALYALHAAECVLRGRGSDSLWACHVAVAVAGVGLIGGSARWTTVAALWLALGTPLWLVDVSLGADLVVTSAATHLLGPLLAFHGVRCLGVPARSWCAATLALGCLQLVSFTATPPELNVNAAFGVYARFTGWFSSYGAFEACACAFSAAAFLGLEVLLRNRWTGVRA